MSSPKVVSRFFFTIGTSDQRSQKTKTAESLLLRKFTVIVINYQEHHRKGT